MNYGQKHLPHPALRTICSITLKFFGLARLKLNGISNDLYIRKKIKQKFLRKAVDFTNINDLRDSFAKHTADCFRVSLYPKPLALYRFE